MPQSQMGDSRTITTAIAHAVTLTTAAVRLSLIKSGTAGGRHVARLARVWHWQRATVARDSHHNSYIRTTPAICRTAAVRLQLSGTSLALEWYETRTNRTIS